MRHAAIVGVSTLVLSSAIANAAPQGCGGIVNNLGCPLAEVKAVSDDGNTAVGWHGDPLNGPQRPFRWTATGGMVDMGSLPGIVQSVAYDVSGDGTTIVGGGATAWRWTAAGGLQDLGSLGGSSRAYGVSDSGGTAVGSSNGQAFLWSSATGMVGLGTLGGAASQANAVSASGAVIVGSSLNASNLTRAFRWRPTTGMQELGLLPGWTRSIATGVSADGSTIVGTMLGSSLDSSKAVRWNAAGVPQDLGILTANGGASALAISSSGEFVVGTATGPTGAPRGFKWSANTGMIGLAAFSGPSGEANDVSLDGTVVVGYYGDPLFQLWYPVRLELSELGSSFCSAATNSTGCGASAYARGSLLVSVNMFELGARRLPPNVFGFFVASRTTAFNSNVPNSQGTLCLGGQIGRLVGPGQILNSGASGRLALSLDLTSMPGPTAPVPVLPGQSWSFQAWFRDMNPTATSNFTRGLTVTFQ